MDRTTPSTESQVAVSLSAVGPTHASPATTKPLVVRNLGLLPYEEAWRLQDDFARRRKDDEIPDTLLLLEHLPVFTIGRRGGEQHVLGSPEAIAGIGARVIRVDRGGDITYHGPGQLVGYPILKLEGARRDTHRYLRDLEEVLIRTARDLGVPAGRREGATGVWVEERKLASIGVKVSAWVTSHGFALNVDPDLSHFALIVPCGLHGVGMTSLAREAGAPVDSRDVRSATARRFREVFGYQPLE